MKQLKKTIKFLMQHPLGKQNRTRTLLRFFIWQVVSRFFPNGIIKSWVGNAKIFMKKSYYRQIQLV